MAIKDQVDYIGQQINVGDIVAVPSSKTSLCVGIVQKLTPKGARILIREEWTDYTGNKHVHEHTPFKKVCAIIKLTPEDAIALRLRGDV